MNKCAFIYRSCCIAKRSTCDVKFACLHWAKLVGILSAQGVILDVGTFRDGTRQIICAWHELCKSSYVLYSSLHRSTTWLLRKTLSEPLGNTVLFFSSHYLALVLYNTCMDMWQSEGKTWKVCGATGWWLPPVLEAWGTNEWFEEVETGKSSFICVYKKHFCVYLYSHNTHTILYYSIHCIITAVSGNKWSTKYSMCLWKTENKL